MTKSRTLIIGLDGATFDLIDPMIEAGDLPALSRLMNRGVRSPLQTWPNTNSAAAWSSMVTGYNSGEHGIFHFSGDLNLSDAGTGWSPVTAASRRKDPFWRRLSAEGQSVGIINVPISYPADSVNGFMIAGMDTPGIGSPGFAHPPELPDDLSASGIDYIIDVPSLASVRRRDPARLPDSVRRMVDGRARTILHLMQSRQWDVLMAVFVATDRVQHHFWPQNLSEIDSSGWNPIRTLYRQIDDFFDKALAIAGEETNVLVVSDHGFGPTVPAKRCMNKLLAATGLLRFRQGGGSTKGRALKTLLRTGRRILPSTLQDQLARSMPGLHLRAVNEDSHSTIDWSATQVFASHRGGRIWINLKGREPNGLVPESDYTALRDQVRDILLTATDALTGKRIIRAVHNREDIYRGPYVEKVSDLIVDWDYDSIKDSLICSFNGRSITVTPDKSNPGNQWRGSHRPEGIFIASGPRINHNAGVSDANIYDIAPTVLYLQGLAVPRDMDGKVITQMFNEDHISACPVQMCEPSNSDAQTTAGLSAEEAQEMEKRLRDLGYIE